MAVISVAFAGIYSVGALLNHTVRTLNGAMPVAAPQSWLPASGRWAEITATTQLAYLGDVLHIGTRYFSIGDVLMWTTLIPMVAGMVYLGFKLGTWVMTRISEVKHAQTF
jgi:hypothetical protein